jgi:hypothetical protein
MSSVVTPRRMISAAEFLESGAVPVDIAARVLSVPLSDMDAGQARVLCLVASMFGHRFGGVESV